MTDLPQATGDRSEAFYRPSYEGFGDVPGQFSHLPLVCFNGNIRAVRRLIEEHKDTQDIKNLLAHYDKDGYTPLHWACEGKHADLVKLLLAEGSHCVDIAAKDKQGCTPLHRAAKSGELGIVKLILRQKESNLESSGCSEEDARTRMADFINTQTHDKRTAMHISLLENQPAIATELLQSGGAVDIPDRWSIVPCDYGFKVVEKTAIDSGRLEGKNQSCFGSAFRFACT